MGHQDLTIAVRSGSDADGGDADGLGDQGADMAGHAFDDKGKGACLFDRAGVLHELLDGGIGCSLHLVAAGLKDVLGSETDMTENRDAIPGDHVDGIGPELASFQFYAIGAGFLDKAGGIDEGAFG